MGAQKIVTLDTHFSLMNIDYVDRVVCRKMALFFSSCWLFFTNWLFYVIRLVTRSYFFRDQIENDSQKDDPSCSLSQRNRDEIASPLITSRCFDSRPEVFEFKVSEYDGFEEKETPSFSFKFQFQSVEDTRSSFEEREVTNVKKNRPTAATDLHGYCFQSDKDFAGFIEEPEIASFHVGESYAAPDDNMSRREEVSDKEYRSRGVLNRQLKTGTGNPHEILKDGNREVSESEKSKAEILSQGKVSEMEMFVNSKITASDENDILSEREYCGFDSDRESITFSDGLSLKNLVVDTNSDEYPFDKDFCCFQHEAATTNASGTDTLTSSDEKREEQVEGFQKMPKTQLNNSCVSDAESVDYSDGFIYVDNQVDVCKLHLSDAESIDFSDGSSVMNHFNDSAFSNEFLSQNDFSEHKRSVEDIDREDGESITEVLESEDFPTSSISDIEYSDAVRIDDSTLSNKFLSDKDFRESRHKFGGSNRKETEQNDEPREPNTTNLQNASTSDSDDMNMNGLESLWEHQDLIEQLRTELRKVRAVGLPTILEESESPKIIEDLNPWRMDGNFLQEDAMDELQKFYKSYRERMRKFDMLNYQKMYAIGFLQLKDPLQLMGPHKTSIPSITSLLSQNFRPHGCRNSSVDPSKKFIKELQSDLETVYVGQACLSWEFLHWQYEKMRELSESDPGGSGQYNQVAGEFQQFEVLLQRFLENEPFRGPRVQNYVQSRFGHGNLLQVPAIKEDPLKDTKEESSENDAITREMLTDILEKSTRIFWDFIKADKNKKNVILKGCLGTETELQDPTDLELFADIRADLQKKEKKLKDLLKAGIRLVKRFQRNQEEKPEQMMFFAQVDMKLVSRVLRMAKITSDQLAWCQKKLNKISFRDRRIHREPSFFLFPC